MNIILIGFMATGKSTVGRLLGRRVDAPYIDTDRELRRIFNLTIPEVFELHGESAFRLAETDLLRKLLAESRLDPTLPREYPRRFILSTGGGTPLHEANRPLLKQLGHVVWLRAKPETIADRCRPHIDKRPLLHGHEEDLDEHIRLLLEQRESVYSDLADKMVWTDETTNPEQVAMNIKASLPPFRASRGPAPLRPPRD